MDKAAITCTVLFQEPYWICVVERYFDERLSACRITFGAEPKDYEVYEFLLANHGNLRFSPAVEFVVKEMRKNPKRIQRDVRRQVKETGIGTKSQQALKLQQEEMKTERSVLSRQEKEEQKERKFDLKQQKKKEKHRGR